MKDKVKIRMQEVKIEMGVALKGLRLSRSLILGQVASSIGISHQQLNKYERGDNMISSPRLVVLAEYFSVPVSYFFGNKNINTNQLSYTALEVASLFNELPKVEKKAVLTIVRKMSEK